MKLFWIQIVVLLREFIEWIVVVFLYYRNKKFRQADLRIFFVSLFHNPYRISKEFYKEHVYGETPITTMAKIAKECEITEKDIVYELGCGRARTCFWLATIIGCKVLGIDLIPHFIGLGRETALRYGIKNLKFLRRDFLQAKIKGATVIYLYGTTLTEAQVETLSKQLSAPKVITVSYPLESPDYKVTKSFPCRFTWGWTEVYLQVKK